MFWKIGNCRLYFDDILIYNSLQTFADQGRGNWIRANLVSWSDVLTDQVAARSVLIQRSRDFPIPIDVLMTSFSVLSVRVSTCATFTQFLSRCTIGQFFLCFAFSLKYLQSCHYGDDGRRELGGAKYRGKKSLSLRSDFRFQPDSWIWTRCTHPPSGEGNCNCNQHWSASYSRRELTTELTFESLPRR